MATNKIKVLFVNPGASIYGSGRSMLTLIASNFFEAEVVCPAGGKAHRELVTRNIRHYALEFGKFSFRQNPCWHMRFYWRFNHILKIARPDVIVINLDGNTPLITLAAALNRIPILRFSRFEFLPPSRFLERLCWLKTAAIICPSEVVKQQVLDWIPENKPIDVHRLYEACRFPVVAQIDPEFFRRKHGIGNEKLIGYIGRIDKRKRIEVCVKALACVKKKIPDVRLLIIGGFDGSQSEVKYQRELADLASSLGVERAVSFIGYLDHDLLGVAIGAFDVMVLPSESESFGIVLIEAWDRGVPTVASDIPAIREITQKSRGGVLCPVGDEYSFSNAILTLLEDEGFAKSLGVAGLQWVSIECDPTNYAFQFFNIVRQVLENHE